MKVSTKHKKILIAVAVIIVIAISSGLYLNKSGNKTIQSAKQQIENKAQNVLDCSKKIAQDKNSQIAQGNSSTNSDCLFLGCGDFF